MKELAGKMVGRRSDLKSDRRGSGLGKEAMVGRSGLESFSVGSVTRTCHQGLVSNW